MRNDQVFVLILIVLLPLTGCIDVADNAEASEDSPEYATSEIKTLHLEEGSNYSITIQDTALKVESVTYGSTDPECSSNCTVTFRPGGAIFYSMICDDGTEIDSGYAVQGTFLPNIAGSSCQFITTSSYDAEAFITFSEYSATNL